MIGLILITTIGVIYSVWIMITKETGFLFSTKRTGFVILLLLGLLFSLYNEYKERKLLITICYENNITLPAIFEREIKSIKVEKFEASLKKGNLWDI
jgi:hypothetical protein